ncbi:MAG: NADH-quinone oxidoreductase subunit J [Opitutales bacterium]
MLSVTDALFIAFAVLTLLPALLVVASRNPVNSAMFMIVSFVGLAGLFVLLEAFFLAALQIMVYAGAVMVLFLFIIMLIEVESSKRPRPGAVSFVASIIAFLLLAGGSAYLIQDATGHITERPEIGELPEVVAWESARGPGEVVSSPEEDAANVTRTEAAASSARMDAVPAGDLSSRQAMSYARSIRGYGAGLFTKYMLPFQVTGFLLLIAMIGVIVISRRYDPKGPPPKKRSPMLDG